MNLYDVVQFNERHKWCGCFGIIEEVKDIKNDIKYLIGVPVPSNDGTGGTAYIFCNESDNVIELVGKSILVPDQEDK